MTPDVWTVLEALKWTEQRLALQGEDNPRQAAQLLTCHATGLSRLALYTNFDQPLSVAERATLRETLSRRLSGEPLQYCMGSAPFRYLELAVAPGVLIPRPETETLVELVLAFLRQHAEEQGLQQKQGQQQEQGSNVPFLVLDVGTGSGNIALSLASECAQVCVHALEPASEALALARANAARLNLDARVAFYHTDIEGFGKRWRNQELQKSPELQQGIEPQKDIELNKGPGLQQGKHAQISQQGQHAQLSQIDKQGQQARSDRQGQQGGQMSAPRFEVVVSNPPYIPTALLNTLPTEVRGYEPTVALDGGEDGLVVARSIAKEARDLLVPGGLLALELHEHCLDAALALVEGLGYQNGEIHRDLAGRPRFLTAKKPLWFDEALRALWAGSCIILPTDTVYGVGMLASRDADPKQVFRLKKRPSEKSLPLLIAGIDELERYAQDLSPSARDLAARHWPGALTLVVNASSEVPAQFRAPDGSVALRVPAHPTALALLQAVGAPLATTSANLSGRPAAHAVADLEEELIKGVSLVIDGGVLPDSPPSTVVSCLLTEPVVLRQGGVVVIGQEAQEE